jgi:hypothetical protein
MAEDNAKQHFAMMEKADARLKNAGECIGAVMPLQIARGKSRCPAEERR